MESFEKRLVKSRRILVASHIHPDGDAIGSLIAFGLGMKKIGKEVTLYNESPIPAVYRFLPSVKEVKSSFNFTDFDMGIVLDCGDLERTGENYKEFFKLPLLVNIDHHATNTGFGDIHLIDFEACATAEIVYKLFKRLQVPLDERIATALYTGILTDTGSFRFSNTNRSAFAIAVDLIETGVDPYRIAQKVYGTFSLERIRLLNMALETIEVSTNGKLSLMLVTLKMLEETGTQPADIDGLINYARGIENVKVAALIQETKNNGPEEIICHVSLRSVSEINVAEIAARYGGGGHQKAAGFSTEMPIAAIKKELIKLAEEI